jgi:hypothetical protein
MAKLNMKTFRMLSDNLYLAPSPSFILQYGDDQSRMGYIESYMRDLRNYNGMNFVKEAYDELVPRYPKVYGEETQPTYKEFQLEVIKTARFSFLKHMASRPPPPYVNKMLLCYDIYNPDAWEYCCSDGMNLGFEKRRIDFFRILWVDKER